MGLLVLLVGCQAVGVPQGDVVKVSRAASGQTLEVIDSGKQTALTDRVRLIGIDAPSGGQEPWATQAKERLQALTGGHSVLLESDVQTQLETQKSQYSLAYVWLDGVLLNEKLVEEGYVLAVPRSPNLRYDERLANAQAKARLRGVGIWNPDKPMKQTPEEFRKQPQSS